MSTPLDKFLEETFSPEEREEIAALTARAEKAEAELSEAETDRDRYAREANEAERNLKALRDSFSPSGWQAEAAREIKEANERAKKAEERAERAEKLLNESGPATEEIIRWFETAKLDDIDTVLGSEALKKHRDWWASATQLKGDDLVRALREEP